MLYDGRRHAGDSSGQQADCGEVGLSFLALASADMCLQFDQSLTCMSHIMHRFMAFDRHMNLVLGDAEEFRKLPPKKGQAEVRECESGLMYSA